MSIFSTCVYCDEPARIREHVLPEKRGGRFLVPACCSCNTSKGGRTPEEWIAAFVNNGRRTRIYLQVSKRLPFLIEHGIVDPLRLWAELDLVRDEHFHSMLDVDWWLDMLPPVTREQLDAYWEVENAATDAAYYAAQQP